MTTTLTIAVMMAEEITTEVEIQNHLTTTQKVEGLARLTRLKPKSLKEKRLKITDNLTVTNMMKTRERTTLTLIQVLGNQEDKGKCLDKGQLREERLERKSRSKPLSTKSKNMMKILLSNKTKT